MHEAILVDTNVFLRHLLNDIPDQAERATRLLERSQAGEVVLYAPATVFFEIAHLLHRTMKIPRDPIVTALTDILHNRGLTTDHGTALALALSFWSVHSPLSFPDCFHLTLARELGMTRIYTFDRKMDRYPGVTRIEP